MKCKICGIENKSCFSGEILGKYKINYYLCSDCGFLQTEEPYWLKEAYSRSINVSDTGYMVRNLYYSKRITILLYLLFRGEGSFLDYAGGYGVFVRLMRDIGFDFQWYDKYTDNLLCSGFEWDEKSEINAVTVFEAFEHFADPVSEIKELLEISDTIIFSTELYPSSLPKLNAWWYFGLDHGQHISFYSEKSIELIANRFNLKYYSVGSLHILTSIIIPKWMLMAVKFSKFGLDNVFRFQLESKTGLDFKMMTK